MEIADVKRQVIDTIDRAKRGAASRRERVDEVTKVYAGFLDRTAVPVFRQIANVLRAEKYLFNVATPGGSVRLMSDRDAEDYIELALDTSGEEPAVVVHTKRSRGRRVIDSERAIGDPSTLTEEDVLAAALNELEPFVDR